jgi:hypothetical protein
VLYWSCMNGRGRDLLENKVDTGPLLHHLHRSTQNGSPQVGVSVPQTTRETSFPGSKVRGVGHERFFVLIVGNDLGEFILDIFAVGGETV